MNVITQKVHKLVEIIIIFSRKNKKMVSNIVMIPHHYPTRNNPMMNYSFLIFLNHQLNVETCLAQSVGVVRPQDLLEFHEFPQYVKD